MLIYFFCEQKYLSHCVIFQTVQHSSNKMCVRMFVLGTLVSAESSSIIYSFDLERIVLYRNYPLFRILSGTWWLESWTIQSPNFSTIMTTKGLFLPNCSLNDNSVTLRCTSFHVHYNHEGNSGYDWQWLARPEIDGQYWYWDFGDCISSTETKTENIKVKYLIPRMRPTLLNFEIRYQDRYLKPRLTLRLSLQVSIYRYIFPFKRLLLIKHPHNLIHAMRTQIKSMHDT